YGQIYITSKNPKKYDFLSLDQIKSEFTKIKSKEVVFMINGTPFMIVSFLMTFIESISFGSIYSIEIANTNTESINVAGSSDFLLCP
ncbi:MAG TPA: hypothetical protein VLR29_01645, partial [Flavobacterium sp.]|nr:hypothetical protein [Flavobacterium sp.]